MAEVTYYWDVKGVTGWDNNPDNIIDGNLETFASTANDGDWGHLESTTCDGVDLGTIIKVELRLYGHGDGDDRIDVNFAGSADPFYETTMPSSADWSDYIDVTNDAYVDGWTWAKVADLQDAMGKSLRYQFAKVAKGNTMYCAKVEIRVTYTPVGPPEKVTQYLAGHDCPEFPHEMDLISDKLPCPPPYD